jgi:hypothetical protein
LPGVPSFAINSSQEFICSSVFLFRHRVFYM